MANPDHLATLKQGVEVWNQWRKEHPDTQPDLFLEDFSAVDLRGFDFSGANVSSSSFREADLRRADFCHANLANADLSDANLWGADLGIADLCEANLEGTNLTDADFQFCNLSWTRLSNADLTRAHFGRTILASVDLHEAKGLSSCIHIGPSSIDHLTIFKSWPLPLTFLRGCGLPETLIEYFTTFLNQPMQFHTCFISYSTGDQSFADRLHGDLQNAGVRCWFAPHDIQGGKKIHDQIDEAIRIYDRLLLILSDHSMNSEWVKTEIANARVREIQEKRQMLFPITLVPFEEIREWKAFDAGTGKDSAREIREYFIPDFSNWKDGDSYTKAFERLLRDLKSECSKPKAG